MICQKTIFSIVIIFNFIAFPLVCNEGDQTPDQNLQEAVESSQNTKNNNLPSSFSNINQQKEDIKQRKKSNQKIKKEISSLKKEQKQIVKQISQIISEVGMAIELEKVYQLIANKEERILKKILLDEEIQNKTEEINKLNREINLLKEDFEEVEGTFSWIKTFDISNNKKYKKGKWNITVKAWDNKNNTSREESINIKIDKKSDIPILNIINPGPNNRVTTNIKLVGTAYDDDAIAKVLFTIDKKSEIEYQCKGTDFWYYDLDISQLSEGTHSLQFKAVDTNGLESKVYEVEFIVDMDTPVILIDKQPKSITSAKDIIISGSVKDGNGIRGVYYSLDRLSNFRKVKQIKDLNKEKSEAAWSCNLATKIMDEGVRTIWIKVVDVSGSEAFQSVSFVLDKTKPQMEIQYPTESTIVDGNFTIHGKILDNVAVKNVSVKIDGNTDPIKILPGNVFFSHQMDLSQKEDGKLKLNIIAEDISGNITEQFINLVLDKSQDKPVVSLYSIQDQQQFNSILPVTGDCFDDDGIKEVQISIQEKNSNQRVWQKNIPTNKGFLFNIDLSDPQVFSSYKYNIILEAVDINGLKGDPVQRTFYIDRDYPQIDLDFLATWATKPVLDKFEFQFKIIKQGDLDFIRFSFLDALTKQELRQPENLKFKRDGTTPNIFTDTKIIDFQKEKWSLAHNLILMKVEVQDKNQRLVSQLIPIVYENPENNLSPLAEQVIGLDVNQLIPEQINNTIFAYFPETPPQLVIGELVIPPQEFYSEKKIYIYKIANELQLAAGIHQGEMV
ncbi:MAG: Ig-like domain-containing protein, partial [Spirochaetes bacterium]|nr:Ig-like domain-containing protein [Spirochaetota bacterium]